MPAAGTCAVCSRPDIADLDARMKAGEPVARVARAARIGCSTLHVHWRRCRRKGDRMPGREEPPAAPPPSKPDEEAPLPSPEALAPPPPPPRVPEDDVNAPVVEAMNEARSAHKKLLRAYERAYKDEDYRLMALLVVQLRRNLAQLVEWSDRLVRGARDDYRPERDELLAALVDRARAVLDAEYPGAALALARVWGTRVE